ncbi:MAG: serine hydrolase [Parachlamydiales bacterium]|jgi:CubicO group peptidase (beta-lactamase class C family)
MHKIYLIIFLVLFAKLTADSTRENADEIDQFVIQTMESWSTPGIALSIVQNDDVVKAQGYGTRERGVDAPVDENTLFQICSLTKAFTGLTASMLVDEKRLEWEEPVRTYWPEFKLKDETATQLMTIRDLLSGRTGLPSTGMQAWRLWWHTNRTEDELIQRTAEMNPAFSFRAHFSYSNMAYVLASKVMEKVSGKPWQEYCAEKIFKPLEMENTTFNFNTFLESDNKVKSHLAPYFRKDPIAYQSLDMIAAAGGIISNAKDMTKWLKYLLQQGPLIKETQNAQSVIEPIISNVYKWNIYTYFNPVAAYGYGWMLYRVGDKEIYMHTGLSDGAQTLLAIVPEEKLGICILSNQSENPALACLLNSLLDKYLKKEPRDWNKIGQDAIKSMELEFDAQITQIKADRNKDLAPTFLLQNYSGEYVNLAFGTVRISKDENSLLITTYNNDKGSLEHWQGDDFSITGIPSYTPILQQVTFILSDDKKDIIGLRMPCVGFFKKEPSPQEPKNDKPIEDTPQKSEILT